MVGKSELPCIRSAHDRCVARIGVHGLIGDSSFPTPIHMMYKGTHSQYT